MTSLRFVGILTLGLIVLGLVASDLGFTGAVIEAPTIPEPDDSGFLSGLLVPFRFAWSLVSSLFQLLTFQMDGVPIMVQLLIGGPIDMMVGLLLIRIIRGSGG